ncbi:MAG: lytic transglycosylase domain-containing protein [Blastocatellia bacterium]
MRLSAIVILVALSGFFAIEARAQEAGLPLSVEAINSQMPQLQRTPTLVIINEAVKPTQNPATPAPKPQSATAKKATGQAATTTVLPLAPLVMQSVTDTPKPAGSMVTTTGNPKYDELIKQSAARNGIDPNLMVAVMRQESGFNSSARSYKGATGLMQLMPGTARRFGVANIYDPAENIEGGAKYLRFLLDTFNGDVELVLAGYNAGENAVIRSGYQVPRYRETQNYVKSISARYGNAKHSSARAAKSIVAAAQAAPNAATFSGSRLSNNY